MTEAREDFPPSYRSHYDDPYDAKPDTVKQIDTVNWPAHYNQGNLQCIDAMVEAFGREAVEEWARITAFKYLWRHKHKGSEQEDIDKAIWYLRWSQKDDPRATTKYNTMAATNK